MRHRKSGVKLVRTLSHRKAMGVNMTNSGGQHQRSKTKGTKAKELRLVSGPCITMSKEDSVANRRLAFSVMRSKSRVRKLFGT